MNTELINLDAEVETLLLQAGLPVSDLSGKASLNLLGTRQDGQLLAVVGIEACGTKGLLRSLAVAPASRGTGLGQRLVADAERWAATRGITTLYLLTTTAEAFFVRLGYKTISRDQAPTSIAATAEFRELCPAASAFMRKVLVASNSHERPSTRAV